MGRFCVYGRKQSICLIIWQNNLRCSKFLNYFTNKGQIDDGLQATL